jgi:hypothetical protein
MAGLSPGSNRLETGQIVHTVTSASVAVRMMPLDCKYVMSGTSSFLGAHKCDPPPFTAFVANKDGWGGGFCGGKRVRQ